MANIKKRYLSGQKEGSIYCPRHRRYYRPDAGCPICRYEESVLRHKGGVIPQMQKCHSSGRWLNSVGTIVGTREMLRLWNVGG